MSGMTLQSMSLHYMHRIALYALYRIIIQRKGVLSVRSCSILGKSSLLPAHGQTEFHQLVKSSENNANHVFHLKLYCIIALSIHIALYHFGEILAYAC